MSDPDWLTDDIFVVADFMDADECAALIQRAEASGFEDATLTSPDGDVRVEDIRNNERVIFEDEDLAADLWGRIEDFVPLDMDGMRACGVNERFRFYRYDPGMQFDWHQDHAFERDDGERSFWTFMVYLNDGFAGGETSFDDSCSEDTFDTFGVTPERGMALFFVHDVHHKGEPVVEGRKYVLRTDVMYRPRRKKRRER